MTQDNLNKKNSFLVFVCVCCAMAKKAKNYNNKFRCYVLIDSFTTNCLIAFFRRPNIKDKLKSIKYFLNKKNSPLLDCLDYSQHL